VLGVWEVASKGIHNDHHAGLEGYNVVVAFAGVSRRQELGDTFGALVA
jgi:hypothetical protein